MAVPLRLAQAALEQAPVTQPLPPVRGPAVRIPGAAESRALVRGVLDAVYFGSTVRAWIIAAVVFVVVLAALALVRRLLVTRLQKVAPRTATEVDNIALGAVRRTSTLFLATTALGFARVGLPDLPAKYDHDVDLLVRLALYVQMASWGNAAVAYWIARMRADRLTHDKAALTSLNLLGVIARVVLWVVLVLLALDAFGVNVTALLTTLGIGGVAIALAVQSTLGDLLASLSIALDKPFVVGDFIAVDQQYQGTVENVGLKSTRLRALSGEQLVIANAELLKARIRNYQRQQERRIQFQTALDPSTPDDKVRQVPVFVREIISGIPQTRVDRSNFSAISDAALVVETVYFVTSADYNLYMDIQQRINLALLERLRAEHVQLAFSGRETVLLTAGGPGSANGVGSAAGLLAGSPAPTAATAPPAVPPTTPKV